jgi:hypothetical protein
MMVRRERSAPHASHAGGDVETHGLSRRRDIAGVRRGYRPGDAIEEADERFRNEPAARGIEMAIAVVPLTVREEALRHDQVEFIAGARHRDVKQAPLLLDFRCRAGSQIGRDAPVDHIQHEDRPPFLTLRGMDGGKIQVVFVE